MDRTAAIRPPTSRAIRIPVPVGGPARTALLSRWAPRTAHRAPGPTASRNTDRRGVPGPNEPGKGRGSRRRSARFGPGPHRAPASTPNPRVRQPGGRARTGPVPSGRAAVAHPLPTAGASGNARSPPRTVPARPDPRRPPGRSPPRRPPGSSRVTGLPGARRPHRPEPSRTPPPQAPALRHPSAPAGRPALAGPQNNRTGLTMSAVTVSTITAAPMRTSTSVTPVSRL